MAATRWASLVFYGVMSVFIVGLFGWLAYRTARDLRHTLACARDGQAVQVEILSATAPDRNGTVTYQYRMVGEGSPAPRKGILQKRSALYVGGARSHAIAIQSASDPRAIVLLGDDGYPLALPPETRDELRAG